MSQRTRIQSSLKTTQSSYQRKRIPNSGKSIQFTTIEIRTYNRILGDNPACSCGPPTELGWDFKEECSTSLDNYECNRQPLRPKLELALSAFERRYLLHSRFGFTHQEITQACANIQKIRKQRAWSKRTALREMKREERKLMGMVSMADCIRDMFGSIKIHDFRTKGEKPSDA